MIQREQKSASSGSTGPTEKTAGSLRKAPLNNATTFILHSMPAEYAPIFGIAGLEVGVEKIGRNIQVSESMSYMPLVSITKKSPLSIQIFGEVLDTGYLSWARQTLPSSMASKPVERRPLTSWRFVSLIPKF